jgi:IclR family transcriptional regulator, KDG regulon repressor
MRGRKMGKAKSKLSGEALVKAVELLELMADGGANGSLSELARRAGLSRYKTLSLLAGVGSKGMVECALESGRYDRECAALLGVRLLENAGELKHARPAVESFLRQQHEATWRSIMKDARPVMESLAREHNEAMYLTILKGDEVLFLDMVDCLRPVRAEPFVGKRLPFFSNAAGKVMRAIDSWDLLEKIGKRWSGSRGGFPDLAPFFSELELIRQKGVAVDCDAMGEGIITVAVAVKDYAGKVVGALAMIGPSVRLLGERLEEEIIPSLLLNGELLSGKFGYARP